MIALHVTTQNEANLLRWNIRHHLEWGIDHISVADNDSTDDTADVAREFGSSVSYRRFSDLNERHAVRTSMLGELNRSHRVEWAAIADTDEFFWAPNAGPRDLLDDTPSDIVAVNFEQKLYLPTVLDPPDKPVFLGQLYNTIRPDSGIHVSYRAGKSFYRPDAVRAFTNDHWSDGVPHAVHRHQYPAVHHYFFQGEDRFVQKVVRLTEWQLQLRLLSRIRHSRVFRRRGELPRWAGATKSEWWSIYYHEGEAGLRKYYRTVVTLSEDRVRENLVTGDLVKDDGLAVSRAWLSPS